MSFDSGTQDNIAPFAAFSNDPDGEISIFALFGEPPLFRKFAGNREGGRKKGKKNGERDGDRTRNIHRDRVVL